MIMDVISVNGMFIVKKFGGGGLFVCINFKNLIKWVVLIVFFVILFYLLLIGVYVVRSFGDVILFLDVLVFYKSGSEFLRVYKLRSVINMENVEFGYFFGIFFMDLNDVCLIVFVIVGGFFCYKFFFYKVILCLK